KSENKLRIKLAIGYILLIAIVTTSIVYILNQIKNLDISKDEIIIENAKVINLSNIITDLYTTENTGRLALVSYKSNDATKYFAQTDSLAKSLIKFQDELNDNYLKHKIDTLIILIDYKTETFKEVLEVQSKYLNAKSLENVKSELKDVQSSFKNNTVKIDTVVKKQKIWDLITTKRKTQQEQRLKQENE